jgi:hypothetical protein
MLNGIKGSNAGNTGRIVKRALLLAVAFITVVLTNGCAMTGQQPAKNQAASSSNSAASNAQSGNSTPNSTASDSSATSPNSNTSNGNTTPQTAQAVLSASNASISFGDVKVGSPTSQLITLTNTGNANLNITGISASGSGFTASGNSNTVLAPNQSENVYVNFNPTSTGSANGAIGIASNATDSMVSISVSGTGVPAQDETHTVNLTWTASSSNVIGYFVDRSPTAGGPYTRLNSSANANPSFADSVTSGTYYYVVTSVDSSNDQSAYSNEVQAIVP